jgi:hypothetical protein
MPTNVAGLNSKNKVFNNLIETTGEIEFVYNAATSWDYEFFIKGDGSLRIENMDGTFDNITSYRDGVYIYRGSTTPGVKKIKKIYGDPYTVVMKSLSGANFLTDLKFTNLVRCSNLMVFGFAGITKLRFMGFQNLEKLQLEALQHLTDIVLEHDLHHLRSIGITSCPAYAQIDPIWLDDGDGTFYDTNFSHLESFNVYGTALANYTGTRWVSQIVSFFPNRSVTPDAPGRIYGVPSANKTAVQNAINSYGNKNWIVQ